MADNFLEKHREDYERRKARWQSGRKTHIPESVLRRLRGETGETS